MGILKIMPLKENRHGGSISSHLKNSIEYIVNPLKTRNGEFVSGLYCPVEKAYETMMDTKSLFAKMEGRQGYHVVLSFSEYDASFETIMKIAKEFAGVYAPTTECVIAAHDNSSHPHVHMVFNSINFNDGRKLHQSNAELKEILIKEFNRLCKEHGLQPIEKKDRQRSPPDIEEKGSYKEKSMSVQNYGICRDMDESIAKSNSYIDFLTEMQSRGYEIKDSGKYLTMRSPGMERFRRCSEKNLGKEYTRESIQRRIQNKKMERDEKLNRLMKLIPENISGKEISTRIIYCRYQTLRFRRPKMNALQKNRLIRMYRIGRLKKAPYSKSWKYKEDIKKFHMLQQQYTFLSNHKEIENREQMENYIFELRKEQSVQQGKIRNVDKVISSMDEMFRLLDTIDYLEPAKKVFEENGESIFAEDVELYENAVRQIHNHGFETEQLRADREQLLRSREEAALLLSQIRKERKQADAMLMDSKQAMLDELEHIIVERKEELEKDITRKEQKPNGSVRD